MQKYSLLVAAAGRGTRSGLPYPKTLYAISSKSILCRIIDTFFPFVDHVSVVASPGGFQAIKSHLENEAMSAEIIIQRKPIGMADAVFRFRDSVNYNLVDHIFIVWGDVPFIESRTVANLLERHLRDGNHVSVASAFTSCPYTYVERDEDGRFVSLIESREFPDREIEEFGERDIGLFVMKKECLDIGSEFLSQTKAPFTSELSFLRLLGILRQNGLRIEAYPIATARETISFNHPDDLEPVK